MCKGDGGANMVTCTSVCDNLDTLNLIVASHVAGGWYLYCTVFLKEMCPAAEQYFFDADFYHERCGAGSGPGLGDEGASSSAGSSGPV